MAFQIVFNNDRVTANKPKCFEFWNLTNLADVQPF